MHVHAKTTLGIWSTAPRLALRGRTTASTDAETPPPGALSGRAVVSRPGAVYYMRLAVLISGQQFRFAHEHMNLNASTLIPGCAVVDVHVVLAATKYARVAAPMTTGMARDAISAWLLVHAAFTSATVQILDVESLERRMSHLDEVVARTDSFLWHETKQMRSRTVHSNIVRWVNNGRMLYLRHLAFRAAMHAENESGVLYSYVLCIREDNRFLEPTAPLPMEAFETLRRQQSRRRGFVALDKHCAFMAPAADKMCVQWGTESRS